MGSLNANGVPVPDKTPFSFRKMDNRITKEDAATDVVETYTSYDPDLNRTLGSGCTVKDTPTGAIADCKETVVWGLYKEGRSTQSRIASDEDNARNLTVATSGIGTRAVIETALQPNTPQRTVRHLGTQLDVRDSVTDNQVASVANSGSFS